MAKKEEGKEEKTIKVVAVRLGYYKDQRRYPVGSGHKRSGEVFEVKESEFSDSEWKPEYDKKTNQRIGRLPGWMKRVPDSLKTGSIVIPPKKETVAESNVVTLDQIANPGKAKAGDVI